MCMHLERLKELTHELPPIPRLQDYATFKDGIAEYRFKKGHAISFNLYSDRHVSIARTLITKNTEFENHSHPNSYELIIVLTGKLEMVMEGTRRILEQYDKIEIPHGTLHNAVALEDVWIIALTVPADDGFPKKNTT